LCEEQGIAVEIVTQPEAAARQGQLVITTTTTTEGYIPFAWLQPGAILLHVSLDDVLPDVVLQAQCVVVDDWQLVKNDPRRLLGRMYRAGQISGPDDPVRKDGQPCRRIDAQLGEIITGSKPGRQSQDDIILVNPFGLAIEDVALAASVYQKAQKLGIGQYLER
jgi:ornithine cyclodeaminase